MQPIRVRMWGDYALFSRPELKTERYSYDVITPSAARGVFDAIYYHPGLCWKIDTVWVVKPIRFTNVRRNELANKLSASNALEAMNGGKPFYQDRTADIQQRASTVLRDVEYVVQAHFELRPENMSPTDSADKFYAIFMERLKKGRNYTQPYFGCREFTAFTELFNGEPEGIDETRDLGIMLYDMDYTVPGRIDPMFFRAKLEHGRMDVAGCEVLK